MTKPDDISADLRQAKEETVAIAQAGNKSFNRAETLERLEVWEKSYKDNLLRDANAKTALVAVRRLKEEIVRIDIDKARISAPVSLGGRFSKICHDLERDHEREKAQVEQSQAVKDGVRALYVQHGIIQE